MPDTNPPSPVPHIKPAFPTDPSPLESNTSTATNLHLDFQENPVATMTEDPDTNTTSPAVAPTGNLEITVSRAELLRELTAAQSVVERKTTIPILSNFLFEASTDGRTAAA